MVNLFRKYQQPLLIIFTVLLIIAFVLLYNGSRSSGRGGGSDDVGRIYGRTVTQTEFDREVRKFAIAEKLDMIDLLRSLVGQAQTRDQAANSFVWNGLVLRHEAGRLQLDPTDA